MKQYLFALFTLAFVLPLNASTVTEINCRMNRASWDELNFTFSFPSPRLVHVSWSGKKENQQENQVATVSNIHHTHEARYVGVNFQRGEKLVFILLTTLFEAENLKKPLSIEVVSSLQGPVIISCQSTK